MDVDSVLAANAPVSGILGAALGESTVDAKARVEEAKKNAKDLTGLVRKKAKEGGGEAEVVAKDKAAGSPGATNGAKRKAEEPAVGEQQDEPKKPKVQEEPAAAEP